MPAMTEGPPGGGRLTGLPRFGTLPVGSRKRVLTAYATTLSQVLPLAPFRMEIAQWKVRIVRARAPIDDFAFAGEGSQEPPSSTALAK
jgi:hypothetical protein